MNDRQLYAQILGISSPWSVTDVRLALSDGKVDVVVSASPPALVCPECGEVCPGSDTRARRWRHLDTCQYMTVLEAEVSRVKCSVHGVKQVDVPWAAPGSGFTLLFEALVIEWLRVVKRHLASSGDLLDGLRHIGSDELSYRRHHEYITVVVDHVRGVVVWSRRGKNAATLEQFSPNSVRSAAQRSRA